MIDTQIYINIYTGRLKKSYRDSEAIFWASEQGASRQGEI